MHATADGGRERRAVRMGCTALRPRQEREAGVGVIRAGSKGTAVPKTGGMQFASVCSTLIREVRSNGVRAHPLFPGRLQRVLAVPCPPHERTAPLPRYESPPRHVIEARYVGDYKVWLEFNDGRKGVVDLADELHGDQRSPLRNREIFSTFYLDYGLASIAWLDGVDFAPEFLYERLKEMH